MTKRLSITMGNIPIGTKTKRRKTAELRGANRASERVRAMVHNRSLFVSAFDIGVARLTPQENEVP